MLLRALGVCSDQEICALIGPEPELHDALQPSLEEAAALGLFSQQAALEFIGGKVQAKRALARGNVTKVDEARNVLASVVLNHVPVQRFNFRPKVRTRAARCAAVRARGGGRVRAHGRGAACVLTIAPFCPPPPPPPPHPALRAGPVRGAHGAPHPAVLLWAHAPGRQGLLRQQGAWGEGWRGV